MCSEWLCEECPPLLSIHAAAANCQQCELGTVCALSSFCLNQSPQLQKAELPPHTLRPILFCTFLKFFDKHKMLTQLKGESFNCGGEEKIV